MTVAGWLGDIYWHHMTRNNISYENWGLFICHLNKTRPTCWYLRQVWSESSQQQQQQQQQQQEVSFDIDCISRGAVIRLKYSTRSACVADLNWISLAARSVETWDIMTGQIIPNTNTPLTSLRSVLYLRSPPAIPGTSFPYYTALVLLSHAPQVTQPM